MFLYGFYRVPYLSDLGEFKRTLTYIEGGSATSKTLSLEVGKTYIIMVAFNSSIDYINPIPTIDWTHSTNAIYSKFCVLSNADYAFMGK